MLRCLLRSNKLVYMIRTTVRLDDNIFKKARKEAIDRGVAFTDLINQALGDFLNGTKKAKKGDFKFKIYRMGQVAGSLSREEIYKT